MLSVLTTELERALLNLSPQEKNTLEAQHPNLTTVRSNCLYEIALSLMLRRQASIYQLNGAMDRLYAEVRSSLRHFTDEVARMVDEQIEHIVKNVSQATFEEMHAKLTAILDEVRPIVQNGVIEYVPISHTQGSVNIAAM